MLFTSSSILHVVMLFNLYNFNSPPPVLQLAIFHQLLKELELLNTTSVGETTVSLASA